MKEFAIYTIGNGELLAKGFNAIAMLMQEGGTMKALIRLGMFTGALMALITTFTRMQFQTLLMNWFVPAFLAVNLFFLPKAKIQIIDPVGGPHAYKVANVPWFLGAVAGTTSTVFKTVTEKFEQAFSEVDDLHYSKTGTMFGSEIIRRSKMFNITDPVFNRNMKSFVNQCVTMAALNGSWYTIDDIRYSKDLWGLVSSKSNWVRHFDWYEPGKRVERCPCREGIDRFNNRWKMVILKGYEDHGLRLFPYMKDKDYAAGMIRHHLPLAFEHMLNIQSSCEEILKQQMMAYATMEAIQEKNQQLGNPINVAIARAHLSQEMNHSVLWGIAAQHLPAMKAVFEIMIYMCLLLVIPLVFLPDGYKILGTWMGLVFWVHLWTPLFAIIYGMVTFLAQKYGMSQMGAYGYTLVTSVGVTEAQKTMQSIAGGLSMSIPFISYALVKGGAGSFVHLASHLGSVSQGASSQAAHEAMTGNYSAGNMHFGNTTMATNTAFKQDRGASYSHDSFSQHEGLTSSQVALSSGEFGIKEDMSHMRFKMDQTESVTAGLNQQAQTSHTMGDQATVAASKSEADSFRQTLDYAMNHGRTIQNSQSHAQNESTGRENSVNKVNSLVEEFAKQNSLSKEQAANFLMGASASGSTNKKGIGSLLSLGLEGNLGGNYQASSKDQEMFQKAMKFGENHHFSENLQNARQSIIEGRYQETDETQSRLAEDVAGSFEHANQFREEAQKHYQKAQTYSDAASYSKNSGVSITRDNTQEFMEWMASQPSDQGTGRMGMVHAKFIAGNDQQRDQLREYQERFQNQKMQGVENYINSHPSASPEQVWKAYEHTSVKNPVSTQALDQVRSHGSSFQGFEVPSSVKETVTADVQHDRNELQNQGEQINQGGQIHKEVTQEKVDDGLFWSVAPGWVKSTVSFFKGKPDTGSDQKDLEALKKKIPGGGK